MEDKILNAKNHIQDIRLQKYKIDENGCVLEHNTLSPDLHASLVRLAEDLYSKDIHFIFELIQNAEDNDYGKDIQPNLTFALLDNDPTGAQGTDGCLCVFNNEIGFQKKHVKSICANGLSTKTKQKGYIGEKGIGFKSVFLVTEQPHIYSNGYRFKFQERDPNIGLGYIVPYWLNQVPTIVKPYLLQTAILLPLKIGKKDAIKKELEQFLPETILFLQHLTGLTIKIDNKQRGLEITRDEHNKPFIHLHSADKESEYCVVTKKFDRPDTITEEKRKNIKDRDVTVAFPLTDTRKSTGRIFSYLPTEIYSGLPFFINADFILTTSRETLHVQNLWNIWLRDKIVDTFLDAFHEMLKSPKHRLDAYHFIPLKPDLNQEKEFFIPIVDRILSSLSDLEIIITNKSDQLALPKRARTVLPVERELFENGDIPDYLQKVHFVHRNIKHKEKLTAIGVKPFDYDDLGNILSDSSWLSKRNIDWFFKLYEYLSTKKATLDDVIKFPLIPTECGQIITPEDGPVYLMPDDDIDPENLAFMQSGNMPGVLFLKNKVYLKLLKNGDVLYWATRTLNLKNFSPTEYIIHSLVPFLEGAINDLEEGVLLKSTRFILRYFREFKDHDINEVKKHLPLLLDDGTIVLRNAVTKQLVVPRELDPESGWQFVFPEKNDVKHLAVVSDRYLKKGGSKNRWAEFFNSINITSAPYPAKRIVKSSDPTALNEYEVNSFKEYHEYSTVFPTIDHWSSPEWLNTLKKDTSYRKAVKKNVNAFLVWIIRHNPDTFKTFFNGTYQYFYRTSRAHQIPSEFKDSILKAPWFPTSKGNKRTCEVFLKTPEFKEMFGNRVPYAHADLPEKICELLQIHQHATTEDMILYLEGLSSNNESVELNIIKKIYRWLQSSSSLKKYEFREAFNNKKLLYIPTAAPNWVDLTGVIWGDHTEILGDLFTYLEPLYANPELKSFFLETLGIAESPDDQRFADVWIKLSGQAQHDTAKTEVALERIYTVLLRVINSTSERPSWWGDFITNIKVWTQENSFKYPHHVFVPDDSELKRLFQKVIDFAWLPPKRSFSDCMPLYQELGIPVLSESVKISLENVGSITCPETAQVLTESAKELIYYWLWNEYKERFESLVESFELKRFLSTAEKECEILKLKFSLIGRTNIAPVIVEDRNAYWDIDKASLYVCSSADTDEIREEVAESLARIFFGGRNLKEYIPKIYELLCADSKKFQKIKNKRGWHLPSDQLKLLHNSLDSAETGTDDESGNLDAGGKDDKQEKNIGENKKDLESTDGKDERQGGRDSHGESGYTVSSGKQAHGLDRRIVKDEHDVRIHGEGDNAGSDTNDKVDTSPKEGLIFTDDSFHRGERPDCKHHADRIVTYVFPPGSEDDDELPKDPTERENQIRIGDCGEERVMHLEQNEGRTPERMPRNNPGYDIESKDFEGNIRYIEVKSIDGPWTIRGIGLTSRQFEENQRKEDKYWLYIVENVLSEDEWRIHKIQNPANKISNYRFDMNWRLLAAGEDEKETLPFKTGMQIIINGMQAIIVDIIEYGASGKKLKVKYEDGTSGLIVDLNQVHLLDSDHVS